MEEYTIRLVCMCSEKQKTFLSNKAKKEDRSVSSIVRLYIEKMIQEELEEKD